MQCSQEGKSNYQKVYNLRILLEQATKPEPDPLSTCVNSSRSAESCLANSPEAKAQFVFNESVLSSMLSRNVYTDYTSICTNSLKSDTYKNATPAAQKCMFNCQKQYWEKRSTDGICSIALQSQISGLSDGIKTCNFNCISPSNTTTPQ